MPGPKSIKAHTIYILNGYSLYNLENLPFNVREILSSTVSVREEHRRILHVHKKASLRKVVYGGLAVVVRSMPGIVTVKVLVPPCLKGVNKHDRVPNLEADNSQDLPCLESRPAAIQCPQACMPVFCKTRTKCRYFSDEPPHTAIL